ncbi:MAG: LytR C-terminal domain-containing protein [Patescibacteria group bacterium]|nr:LytR C-terminal domain-containing protein [Patescibacteria group bacterium]
MKRKKQQGKNLKFAIIFFAFVACLVIASIAIKTLILIKNSGFDGQHRFNLAVYQARQVSVISFSPETRSISFLNLKGKLISNNLGQYLKLPIDATFKTSNMIIDKQNIAPDMSDILFHYSSKDTSLTIIDAFKLWLFAKDIPADFIYQRDALVNDTLTINSFVSSFFIDPAISNEKTTIEIINATPVYGLANRLAVLITNIGGDVVLISSSDKAQGDSQISYSGDLNYTIKKLSLFLEIKPIKSSKRDISDVKIVLGKDILSKLKF